ncbi:hypothetical protein ACFU7Y_22850 [Kitasatospora sp. NPDC057542]|uniref:hypothetical protein n=1 Tax=Streptomycetaceae TaxID=2062 RepID=UPI001CCF5D39|nr:hypothetical protein [Streptomyces sp. LS1784]
MTAATGTAPPPPAEAATPRTPGEALALLADRRATGALHGPLGSLHLVDGQVTAAESSRAPGLADLLIGCGRIAPEDWAELLRVHGPRSEVGEALVERRLITRGELELGHLGTLFDAAFFVLADPSGGVWRFEAGARHWLGPVAEVDPARIRREVERRRQLLDGIWPWAQLDTAPVRPAEHGRRPSRRPCGRRRRELLDHADGHRTPADLARLLGRSGFGVTADIRRLAAVGLLDALRPPGAPTAAPVADAPPTAAPAAEVPPPAASGPAGGLHRRVPGASLRGAGLPGAPVTAAPAAARTGAESPAGTDAPAGTEAPAGTDAPTRSERPPTTAAAHPLTVPDPDIALLTRIRDLLEARL